MPKESRFRWIVVLIGLVFLLAPALAQTVSPSTNSFANFETAPVHPIALSPDRSILAVVNLPDGRLELFDLHGESPSKLGSVPVGVDPVSVRFRTATELWVVNHISDSVSIIRLPQLRVAETLATADGPSDVAFSTRNSKAFVSCSFSNAVMIFEPFNGRFQQTGAIAIDGDRPKAMSVGPDGKVHVAVFESGNSSTIVNGDVAPLDSFPPATALDFPNSPHGGINPPPNKGADFVPAISTTNPPPRVGLIVKKNAAGRWMDDNLGDWSEYISGTNAFFTGRTAGWDLSDNDVAVIDPERNSVTYRRRLMNICMDLAVNPVDGRVAVVGTDAMNEVRYEPVLNGVFVKAKLALIDTNGATAGILDLNPHLDYLTKSISPALKRRTIGDPRGVVWNSNGTRLYVAGMGSGSVLVYDSEGRPLEPDPVIRTPEGPVGLALDDPRSRLYVLNRFANSISVIDTDSLKLLQNIPLHDSTPEIVRQGRKHFYDTQETSGLGQVACASCHLDARFDRLAWDLGDPTGAMFEVTVTNRNFSRFPPGERHDLHPMKGPMVTQSLQDIIGHEPFHWRGDRDGLEQFNGTYTNLQAAAQSLTTGEMSELKGFLATIRLPPNPFRTFSNSLPATISMTGLTSLGHRDRVLGAPMPPGRPEIGMNLFRQQGSSGCIHCHALPSGLGPHMNFATNRNRWLDLPLGTNGEHSVAVIGLRRSDLLPVKIPSLRNLADKAGLSFQGKVSRQGFGYTHDGSVDTLQRFLQESLLLVSDQQISDVLSFLFCVTGADLPPGVLSDRDRPPGLPNQDVPAAVGKQDTLTKAAGSEFLARAYQVTRSATNRLELIAHGYRDGLPRGWLYNRVTQTYTSDREGEVLGKSALEALATSDNPMTFTVVLAGTGRRLAIDQDEDGVPNRTELDYNSDPADPKSIPIRILGAARANGGFEVTFRSVAGRQYRVQRKSRLTDPAWQDAPGGALAAESEVSVWREAELTGERYFRIVEVVAP